MLVDDPRWYQDAIIYELHVRAFQDSDGDGIGDFRGLTQRLDYLQDLGITAIWLLPFYPSPLRDDGYDIADYTGIHPSYGTLRDAEVFLKEAHRRGLRVITELVLNHTSDQHPWFQRARRSPPGSVERDFYVWSDAPARGVRPERYNEARIIFQDYESSNWSWDPVARAYFWHRFFGHQPDLNYDNPAVREALLPIVDFWLGRGVDGLRLDAVPYLFERDGTSCENLPETYRFLKELRRHVDERFPNRMLLAEANQWPEDAAAYFADGQACHMAFHFPLMPRMFMAIRMEDRFPILDILAQTPPICEACQWALFLRNHDELTLEMVTDEERDYMNRVYACDPQARLNLGIRRRLAPLMGNDRRGIELMSALLFSLPGTPVLYYGDEIGMGDNIYLGDRDGVRTPMQWSFDRNAGFSRANPQRLYLPAIIDPEYHYETVNVESQQENPHSLLHWTKRLIAQRRRFRAFGRGSLEFLHPENPKVLAFLRRYEGEQLLVVANLSRYVQHAELDLGALRGLVPVEVFGRVEFPPIGDRPYFLAISPHSFYWFALERPRVGQLALSGAASPAALPEIVAPGGWEQVFAAPARSALEEALGAYLVRRFGGDARRLRAVEVEDAIPLSGPAPTGYLALVRVEPYDGEPATYQIPLALAEEAGAAEVLGRRPGAGIARLRGARVGLVYDPSDEPAFCAALLGAMARGDTLAGQAGEVLASGDRRLERFVGPDAAALEPRSVAGRQNNHSVVLADRLVLKYFRRIDLGANPELEIGRFLAARGFPHIPPIAGALEYRRGRAEPQTLAVLQDYVPNEGNAWEWTLDALGRYFERSLSRTDAAEPVPTGRPLLELAASEPPAAVVEGIGPYLEAARLMGRRTAELHLMLASDPDDPAFAPEPFTGLYQRSLYQTMRSRAGLTLRLLRRRRGELPEAALPEIDAVLARGGEILPRLRSVLRLKITAMRTRCHGDYHLGQLLNTGQDFVIIDFEGEAFRALSERRLKRSPLQDVSGLLHSLHYAAHASWSGQVAGRTGGPGPVRREDIPRLEPWTRLWVTWVGAAFLGAYLETAAGALFLPGTPEELGALLDAFLLERSIESLGYELDHRPDWAWIALRGVLIRLDEGR